jgi:hypothetical protein
MLLMYWISLTSSHFSLLFVLSSLFFPFTGTRWGRGREWVREGEIWGESETERERDAVGERERERNREDPINGGPAPEEQEATSDYGSSTGANPAPQELPEMRWMGSRVGDQESEIEGESETKRERCCRREKERCREGERERERLTERGSDRQWASAEGARGDARLWVIDRWPEVRFSVARTDFRWGRDGPAVLVERGWHRSELRTPEMRWMGSDWVLAN